MADATTGGDIEGALQKAVDRIAAQERLPTLQSDLVLLAIISIMLGYFAVEEQRYWSRFTRDHTRFKILAAWLAFLEAMFFAIRFSATWITTSDAVLGGNGERPGFLSIWSTVVTTLIEATVEGFFVWRLWTVTKKWWMRYISVFLWAFSFVAHCVWVGMAGAAGRSNIVDDANQLVVVIIAFWGTFAEGSFVATCLLYELQFAHDRKVIKRNRKSSAVGRLVSLAMRTSGILVVFELIVAIAVTVQSQPPRALLIEVEFSAGIYTVLAAIIVIFTLNWRATIRPPGDDGRLGAAARPGEGEGSMGMVPTPTFLRSVMWRGGGGGGGAGAGRGGGAATTFAPEAYAVGGDGAEGDGEGRRGLQAQALGLQGMGDGPRVEGGEEVSASGRAARLQPREEVAAKRRRAEEEEKDRIDEVKDDPAGESLVSSDSSPRPP